VKYAYHNIEFSCSCVSVLPKYVSQCSKVLIDKVFIESDLQGLLRHDDIF